MSSVVVDTPDLKLGRAFKWMFASPNWFNNLLWVFICTLLGSVLIGSFVLVGYQMEIIQRRSRGGANEPCDFDPNRFVDYLIRGLIPVAVYMVVGIAVSSVMALLILIWTGGFSALVGSEPEGAMILLLLGPVFVLIFAQVAAILFVAMPLAIRAGLTNDLGEGFKLNWALETAKLMWPHMLLCLLYVIVCSFMSMLGILFCFVGIFVTNAWLQLAMADLGAQMYDIYLWKGGQPLPQKSEAQSLASPR